MKRVVVVIFILFVMVVVVGCGGKRDVVDTIVESNGNYYVDINIPDDPDYIFFIGHGVATDCNSAIDKAKYKAILDMIKDSRIYEMKWYNMNKTKSHMYKELSYQISILPIELLYFAIDNVEEVKRRCYYRKDENKYEAFILLRMLRAKMNKMMLSDTNNLEKDVVDYYRILLFDKLKKAPSEDLVNKDKVREIEQEILDTEIQEEPLKEINKDEKINKHNNLYKRYHFKDSNLWEELKKDIEEYEKYKKEHHK